MNAVIVRLHKKRVYFTNSLYSAWDEQFYPAGVGSWMVKLDAAPEGGRTGNPTKRGRRTAPFRLERMQFLDIKPDPRNPSIVRIIEPEELSARTGYSRPHTVHCGPEGIYVSALGAPDGGGPAGIFLLGQRRFENRLNRPV
jgi:hypothetical protein